MGMGMNGTAQASSTAWQASADRVFASLCLRAWRLRLLDARRRGAASARVWTTRSLAEACASGGAAAAAAAARGQWLPPARAPPPSRQPPASHGRAARSVNLPLQEPATLAEERERLAKLSQEHQTFGAFRRELEAQLSGAESSRKALQRLLVASRGRAVQSVNLAPGAGRLLGVEGALRLRWAWAVFRSAQGRAS